MSDPDIYALMSDPEIYEFFIPEQFKKELTDKDVEKLKKQAAATYRNSNQKVFEIHWPYDVERFIEEKKGIELREEEQKAEKLTRAPALENQNERLLDWLNGSSVISEDERKFVGQREYTDKCINEQE